MLAALAAQEETLDLTTKVAEVGRAAWAAGLAVSTEAMGACLVGYLEAVAGTEDTVGSPVVVEVVEASVQLAVAGWVVMDPMVEEAASRVAMEVEAVVSAATVVLGYSSILDHHGRTTPSSET